MKTKSFSEVRQKVYQSQVQVVNLDDATHTATVEVTSVAPDRDNECVLPSALHKWLPAYLENPKLLWGHERKGPPESALGVCLSLAELPDGTGWEAKFRYDVEINPRAELVWKQLKVGTQKGFSISFLPHRWVVRQSRPEQIAELPEVVKGWLLAGLCDVVYTEVEILEISNVHVPCNRDAILRSVEETEMKVENKIETQPQEVVEKSAPEPVVKYHARVNDIAGRLRNAACSLEGPGWDEYDGELVPPADRVQAVLDILSEITQSVGNLAAKPQAPMPEVEAKAPRTTPKVKALNKPARTKEISDIHQPLLELMTAMEVSVRSQVEDMQSLCTWLQSQGADVAMPADFPSAPSEDATAVAEPQEESKTFDPVEFARSYIESI